MTKLPVYFLSFPRKHCSALWSVSLFLFLQSVTAVFMFLFVGCICPVLASRSFVCCLATRVLLLPTFALRHRS